MNWDQVQGNWKQFKGQVKQKWGDLTDDDLDRVEGRQEELAGLIQKRYGRTREEAEREVNDWTGHPPGFFSRRAGQSCWNSGSMSRTCRVSMNRGPVGARATRSRE